MRIALITGASSGLGREYTRLAAEQGDFDQIWVIARRDDRLRELASSLEADIRPVALDLTKPDNIEALKALLLQAAELDDDFCIGLLVNAAGFGKFGTCDDMTQAEVDAMIDLNCRALVDLTQLALPYMAKGSRIIQIASSAAFQPLQGLAVYAASKSFVLSYTRALRRELPHRGIYVTAVCPTWVKTEFIKVAHDTKNGTTVQHPWPQISAERVARWSMFVNRCNYPVATCGVIAFLMRVFCKVIPAPVIMWIWEGLRRI